jgi:glycosyltransferase involved in cell wall biosynthesis
VQPLQLAIVAPSLRFLGGQAVQADRLIRLWRNDPAVHAWLVPHDPVPPRPFRRATKIKYARTVVVESTYLPLLVRELSRADVVHIFSASYTSFLLAPLPAVIVARLLGKPVVLNYRSGQAPDHLKGSAIARSVLRRVDRVVVPSRFLVDVMREFGIDAAIVPNVVDLDGFPFRDRDPLRPRLLSTRNFEPLYNVACTLRAFRLLQDRWPDASLTLVGSGSEEASLRALAAALRLRHLTFTGPVAPAEISRFYSENDIYVQTPNLDNMPGSVLEAFAAGLPTVSTEAGGVPVILTHGKHGLLAPLNDHDTIAALVARLLDRPDYARQLARDAHETCRAYIWPGIRSQWLAIYDELVTPRRAPARDRSAMSLSNNTASGSRR